MPEPLPILYSFRRCPYAIRARIAFYLSGRKVGLREVVLKNKPEALLRCSAKGTVPVLHLASGEVIEESVDILHWALADSDPQHVLQGWDELWQQDLLAENDGTFKAALDHYKYADRFPEFPAHVYRERGEVFLQKLEQRLMTHPFLTGSHLSWLDIAIFPFVRQFAFVDMTWFQKGDYPNCLSWLNSHLQAGYFLNVMSKYPAWEVGEENTAFPSY